MTDEQLIDVIFRHLRDGTSYAELARECNVSESTIRRWCAGETRIACYREASKLHRKWLKSNG